MKWSSHPGASTATNASSTMAPERSIAPLKVSSWRLMASGPFDLTAPRATTRTVTGGIGFSPGDQEQRSGVVHVGVEIGKFVAFSSRMPSGRRLARSNGAHLNASEMRGVMGETAGCPNSAYEAGLVVNDTRFNPKTGTTGPRPNKRRRSPARSSSPTTPLQRASRCFTSATATRIRRRRPGTISRRLASHGRERRHLAYAKGEARVVHGRQGFTFRLYRERLPRVADVRRPDR